jgi:hypothetical protein
MGPWNIETTDQFNDWYLGLSEEEQDLVNAAVDLLEERGPELGRPHADRVSQSTIHNMKELIPPSSDIRFLFVFDPRRTGILLVGGNKAGLWNAWYDEAVPIAERLYAVYLEELEREGLIPR